MAVKQIIAAECDAVVCRYENEDGGRRVDRGDHVYNFDDVIFHAGCFDQLTPHEALRHFQISLKSGEFRPSIPTDSEGLPDTSTFLSTIPNQRDNQVASV